MFRVESLMSHTTGAKTQEYNLSVRNIDLTDTLILAFVFMTAFGGCF